VVLKDFAKNNPLSFMDDGYEVEIVRHNYKRMKRHEVETFDN
jgi:hypothetical protein